MGNYDQRKQEEERRVQNIMERLKTLSLELSPPGPSTEAGLVKCVLSAKKENWDGRGFFVVDLCMYFIVHAAGGLTSPQQFNLHASLQSISLSDRFNDN